ncbi:MAG: response regulator, partial [Bacillota bacterium]
MYRLMIVEDEKWEREGLLDFIDWSGMGIEIVGCACNGIDGIKMSELFHPQIIITDIKMPKLDGIQMSRNIRTFLPDAKIIILSGYDDFQYAKQTFDFQAFAYILKPVEKRLLEEVLKDAVSVLERENSRKKELDNLKSQWLKYIKSSETNMFLDMLECKTDYNHFCEFAPISRLKISGNKVVAIFSLYFIPEEIKFFDSLSDDNIQEFMNAFGIVLDEGGIVIPCGRPLKETVVCMDSTAAAEELETKLSRIKDNL